VSFFWVGIVVLRGIHHRHHAASVSDAERERCHVEEHEGLSRRRRERPPWTAAPMGDHLVGLTPCAALSRRIFFTCLLHERHARRAADQNDLVDVARRLLRIGERLATGSMLRSTRSPIIDSSLRARA